MHLLYSCQFVVKADGDYTAYLTNPDLLVPWETIEQIVIPHFYFYNLLTKAVEFALGMIIIPAIIVTWEIIF